MKYLIVPAVLAATMLSACDSPSTNSDVAQYQLVEFYGRPLPAPISPEGAACADSLQSGEIILESETDARWITHEVRNCSGTRSPSMVERQGTYSVVADTVRFRWRIDNDPILTHYTQDGVVSGDFLHFVSLVYSEANPNGVETVWAKFRRR
jgi:hypothetical protein